MIVDDDRESIDFLCRLLEQLQVNIETLMTETDTMRAFKILRSHKIDLLFLDVEMPVLSGLALLKSLEKRPPVILTTAYPQYAMDAYALGLEECLHKPIDLPRLITAIERTLGKLLGEQLPRAAIEHMFLPELGSSSILKVYFADIICIRIIHNDATIYMPGTQVTTRKPLSYILSKLPSDDFIRVHRSDVVAVRKVIAYNRKSKKLTLMGHNERIPVSKTYQQEFMRRVMPNLEGELTPGGPVDK